MIFDPEVQVICDTEECESELYLPMSWTVGGYNLDDDRATLILALDHNWVTVSDKHYCDGCVEMGLAGE